MAWTMSDSVDEFHRHAGALLRADPAANTRLLTVSQRLVDAGPTAFGGEPASFGWWRADTKSPVAGAFLVTPPYPLLLSVMPDVAAAELAAELGRSATAITGRRAVVDAFVACWNATTGGDVMVEMEERQFRLGTLVTPNVPGRPRLAGENDRKLLLRWFDAFAGELGGPHGDTAAVVDSRLAGAIHLWEHDGQHVSVAAATPVVAGMARIGPVYTPPAVRGRGYASAVTAAASADALARGADQCCCTPTWPIRRATRSTRSSAINPSVRRSWSSFGPVRHDAPIC